MASIHLKMGVDNAQFKTGLEQAKGKAQDFKKTVGKVMGGVLAVAGVGMAVNKLMQGIDVIRDKYDRLAKLTAQHGNINVAFFQRAAFVAEQSGTNVEAVAKSMNKLLISTRDAAAGSKMYAQAFEDLNLNIQDFQKLNQEEKFKAIADATRDAADADKAKTAVLQLMGARATELIPMLQAGSKGFEEIAKSVTVLNKQSLKDIEAFNDEINRMKTELLTLAAVKLPPVLNELIDFTRTTHDIFEDGFFQAFKGKVIFDKETNKHEDLSKFGQRKKMMQERRDERASKVFISEAKQQARDTLDRSNITGSGRENILADIENFNDMNKIESLLQHIQDVRVSQGALETQQEFLPKDAGGSSTLLNSMLGELQKINQSGIDIKGQGMNKVELNTEPVTNAFGG
tara:strand:+ start:2781 stop:3983 length:1203 start_codon:yes stop_codon:yes gene_type:complete